MRRGNRLRSRSRRQSALYLEFYAKPLYPGHRLTEAGLGQVPGCRLYDGSGYDHARWENTPDRDRPPPRGPFLTDVFDITFEDPEGVQRHAYQTCYGISERSIAALISLHGDDKGLVLPPDIAPVQVVVVPITIGKRKDDVAAAASAIESTLKSAGIPGEDR